MIASWSYIIAYFGKYKEEPPYYEPPTQYSTLVNKPVIVSVVAKM